jgi:hypothetical protein
MGSKALASGFLMVVGLCQAAPALRCELATRTVGEGASCLDPAALDGRSIAVPSNVTRIGKDGLALCAQQSSVQAATDIEYLIDNSTSMSSGAFWVDPATVGTSSPDTSFFIDDCSKQSGITGTKVALRKRHFGGTGYGTLSWDTLLQVPSTAKKPSVAFPKNCAEANDPYSMRAAVVQAAIAYQASLDSASQAGMIQFYGSVSEDVALRTLSGSGLTRLLDSAGLYPVGGSTDWTLPLSLASQKLDSSPNPRKAIIMVSDGEPNKDVSGYRALVATAGFPPVFGIFLGDSVVDVPEMDTLTRSTGGRYWIVPPTRPDSLQSVIRSIVASVMSSRTPSTATLANLTNGQASNAVGILRNADSTYQMELDSVIALDSGANSLRMVTSWVDGQGDPRSDTSSFVLDVGGAAATASGPVPGDSVFATVCRPASALEFLDAALSPTGWIYQTDTVVSIEFLPSDTALPLPASVTVTELGGGDLETLLLPASSRIPGSFDELGRLKLSVSSPWNGKPQDGTVEVESGPDTVVASWCYPRDGRDCASGRVAVRPVGAPFLTWSTDSVTGPAGTLVLVASLPAQGADTVSAVLGLRGSELARVLLTLGADSLFRDTVPFRQGGTKPSGDTLWIPAPTALDPLTASVTWAFKDSVLSDTARIRRPDLSLSMVLDSSRSQRVRLGLQGASPDSAGKAWVEIVSPVSLPVAMSAEGSSGWSGVGDLASLLPQSPDSVEVSAFFVDPVYLDTVRAQVRMASPWFPATLSATPDTLDPVRGDSVELVVHARDPDTSSVDTVQVTALGRSWLLVETARNSGEFRLRLSARDLDTAWTGHSPQQAWPVVLSYGDSSVPGDSAVDTVWMEFQAPPLRIALLSPLVPVPTGPVDAGSLERRQGGQGMALQMQGDTALLPGEPVPQSIAVRLWEPAKVSIHIYDQLGIAVNAWQGTIVPADGVTGSLALVLWDGRDQGGRPADAGVYLVRVVVSRLDGGFVSNRILRLGLK